MPTPSGVWGCDTRCVVRRGRVWEMFRASERDLLLATVPKVGKSTGRNLRFLHFRTRYSACRSRGVYHAFAGEFPFRFVKRIVSAPAPLPLADAEKKSLRLSGSGVSLQVNSLVPSSEGGFGGCASTGRADRVVRPYGGSIELLPFIGWEGQRPPTKVLSDRWRSAGGGVRAPRPTKNLSRLGCQSYIKSARVSARPKDISRSISSVQSLGMQSITQLRPPLLSPSSARVGALSLLLSVSGAAV